jgi:hypothetical protein
LAADSTGDYFASYFSTLTEAAERRDNETLLSCVNMLLSGRILEISKEEVLEVIRRNELHRFRTIGVYDMQSIDEDPDNLIDRTR